jgi:hypothetical protein
MDDQISGLEFTAFLLIIPPHPLPTSPYPDWLWGPPCLILMGKVRVNCVQNEEHYSSISNVKARMGGTMLLYSLHTLRWSLGTGAI